MSRIEPALGRLFDRHRIVFWYDIKQELQAEFDALVLPEVEKIALGNNQFQVKYRILRGESDRKFLIYHSGPAPADLDNWLLDVQLAHGEFRADQISLWLGELGLGLEFTDIVAPHTEFLRAGRRREALKSILHPDDTPRQLHLKMLAVCVQAEPRLDDILEHLLAELATDEQGRISLVRRCGLDVFLWDQLERTFGYSCSTPGIHDFCIDLFKSCYAMALGEVSGPTRDASLLTPDALVFMKRWKDSVRHHDSFEGLSAECAGILNIKQDLQPRNFRDLVDLDVFELVDKKILSDLVHEVANRTISAAECDKLIRRRRQSHWYARYEHPYQAIGCAAEFVHALEGVNLSMRSLADGIEQYCRTWYRLDQLYRKFVYHLRESRLTTLLTPLAEWVENLYVNNFLLKVNDQWQPFVDEADQWAAATILPQQKFFERRVEAFLRKEKKVFVIISDALRYEIGEELRRRISHEDRYDATLEPALAMLPSYTQLGMAALLPHKTLEIRSRDGSVLVDGNSSQGTANRKKILERALPGRATALKAEELMALTKDESRSLIRDHDVVYVYHNRIDAVGDKRESEERVFEAVEATLEELVKIIKKMVNANASNLLVTADHGFVYQNQPLDESDFASQEPVGEQITLRTRRFVLGKGLVETSSFKRFAAAEVGLDGETEILIPKSVNRLRLQGAGSRFVHGGATLQEVIIPILQINKKRRSDVSQVDVDILRGSTSTITTGQLTVALYQTEPVTAKRQSRTLRAGIYTRAGELISDQHDLLFDMVSDNARERETTVQFVLTQTADQANDQEVFLRLEERVANTSHYREYRAAAYWLRRAFTSDFDF